MFRFTCPHCHAALRSSTRSLGRNIPCPKCQQVINIPAPVNVPAPTSPPNWLDDVEKVDGMPTPFTAVSSPPVLEPTEMPDPKAMQQAQPPVAMIVTDSLVPATREQQSSGNGIGNTGLHLYLSSLLRKWKTLPWKTRVAFLGHRR